MVLQGLAWFPGVRQVQSCEASFSHGVSPSVFRLNIAPQPNWPAAGGDLTLTFGRTRIRFRDCRVNSASIARNQGGMIVSLEIFDRRWKWQDSMGMIGGHYNVRGPNNKILKRTPGSLDAIDDTERTPQQLARLCLDAMGEKGYNVSALPNEYRPQVDWEVESPAGALQRLCEELGCRVVPGVTTNRVAICRTGVGAQLPNGPIIERSGTIDPPERPDELIVVAAPNRYEVDFMLEAVGLDTDDQVKPIAELSYRPDLAAADGGWGKIDPKSFESVADDDHRKLAKESIFRWYRIKISKTSPQTIPGYGKTTKTPSANIDNRDLILPIETERTAYVVEDGQEKNKPAVVFGVWYREDKDYDGMTATSLTPLPDDKDKTVVDQSFSIDVVQGIVKFGQPVYKNAGDFPDWTKAAADLVLRTACSVRDKKTRAWIRYERSRKKKGRRFGTKPKYLLREELALIHVPTYNDKYGPASKPHKKVFYNKTKTDKEADYLLDVAERQYQMKLPETVRYAGLIPINLDGAIQSVTYTVGGQGAFTTAHRNHDPPTVTNVSYKEKQRMERAKEAAEKTKRERIKPTKRDIERASAK